MPARDEADEVYLEELKAAGRDRFCWLERLLEMARRGVSLARCSLWSEGSRPVINRVKAYVSWSEMPSPIDPTLTRIVEAGSLKG